MIALNSPVVAHAIGATATISSSPLYQNSTKQLHPTLSPRLSQWEQRQIMTLMSGIAWHLGASP